MKKNLFILISILLTVMFLFPSQTNAIPLSPINNSFKEGIYRLPMEDNSTYSIKYKQIDNKPFSIFVLDENNNVIFKNSKCSGECSAISINNKNTLIIITKGELFLYFDKI